VTGRVSRADQLPLSIPLELPFVAFRVLITGRLPIRVPGPASHASELIGDRDFTVFGLRIKYVFLTIIGPVAHDPGVSSRPLPCIEGLQSARQGLPDHQTIVVSEAPHDLSTAVRHRLQFARIGIGVTHQRFGGFTLDTVA
jgi:hypothetical protein